MNINPRLYSFVAGLYLSPLQRGLQTAHVVSEITSELYHQSEAAGDLFTVWAHIHKTIIILDAGNHRGVEDAFAKAYSFGEKFDLPTAIFHEDEDSMNGMATGCGIIVPDQFYDVKFEKDVVVRDHTEIEVGTYRHNEVLGTKTTYHTFYEGSPEFEFIEFLKSYRLAQS